VANADITGQVTTDLATAESIAIPLTLALLVLVFGAVVAGLLPLLVGGIAIAATFAVLSVLAEVTDVSIFALNLTTALGLGLGIDYSLLIVSRFREELAAGRSTAEAVDVTLRTAGRTVIFSAATIAAALSALLVFPLYFLRSFAYAGTAVVAVAALASVVTLPALLVVLGPRVDALRVRRRVVTPPVSTGSISTGSASAGLVSSGFWSRLASFVMRRPVIAGLPVVALLLTMGLPFLHVNFGLPDDRALPAAASQARQVGDVLRAEFTSQDSASVDVVLTGTTTSTAVGDYAVRLSRLADVARVDAATGTYVAGRQVAPAPAGSAAGSAAGSPLTVGSSTRLTVVPSVDPYGDAAQALVGHVRDAAAPGAVLVGGPTASLVDVKATIGQRLPLAGALIALTTFVLLFLFTGSVVLPLKALVINAVSLVGVLGVMVLIFQDGHLSSLLGFTAAPLSITMPLLMFCVAFGLSMDYEVFLLGRIKEMHDAGADTTTAVAAGLERTGRIVSTAAALLAITFFAFVSSKVSFIQMFGLGTGIAIVLDATLVRGVLVPSLMRIMGRANWWAPAPLRRFYERFGLSDGDGAGLPPAAPVPEFTRAGA
jgi:RND superfamily putative drug exporter